VCRGADFAGRKISTVGISELVCDLRRTLSKACLARYGKPVKKVGKCGEGN